LNAFERARLASEDVINGLTEAHDEPEFIIDLSPTTGPVPVINPEHPSVKPFDREVVEDEISVVEVAVEETAIFDHETAVITEVIIEEPAVVDVVATPTVEEFVVAEPEVIVEEEVATIAVETASHPVHDVTVDEHSSDDPEQTNVVSLFGRGRRSHDVPEVEDVVEVAEVPEVIEVVDEPEVEVPSRTPIPGVDDIFAKLRAGSTADVAVKASEADAKPAREKKAPAPASVVADPARFTERNEALAPLVVAMARKLKRVLADEQNDVLQHLRLKRSSLEMEAFLGTIDEHAARYAAAVVEETMVAAGAGAKSLKSAGGSSKRVTQKAVASHVAASVAEGLVAGFREETRIAIGEAEGDREILASLMRDVYRKWKMELIDQHVDDIAYSAYSKGGFLAMENTSRLGWMVDPDAPCCSECEDNSLAGAVTKGESFPTGHQLPPAHPGCRCLVCPVQD